MVAQNYRQGVEAALGDALQEVSGDEEVWWDLITQIVSNQPPVVVVLIWMRGVVLDSVVHTAVQVPCFMAMTPEAALDLARQAMEQLREARSQQVQESMPNGKAGPLHLP